MFDFFKEKKDQFLCIFKNNPSWHSNTNYNYCNHSEKIKRVCDILSFLFIQFPCAPLRGKIIGMCLIKTFSMKSINCFRLCRDSFFTWMYTVNILQYISCIHQEHIWLILSFLSHSLYAGDNSNCCNSSIRSTMPKKFYSAYVTCDR